MPQTNQKTQESAQAFMAHVACLDVGLCPCCKQGRLRTVEVLAGAVLYLTRAPRETMLNSATIGTGHLDVLRLRWVVCYRNYTTVPL
jgi:hypothetical protein